MDYDLQYDKIQVTEAPNVRELATERRLRRKLPRGVSPNEAVAARLETIARTTIDSDTGHGRRKRPYPPKG